MEVLIKIAVVIFGFAAFVYALTRTEYEECDGTGRDLCPFPRCENAPYDDVKRHGGVFFEKRKISLDNNKKCKYNDGVG